MNVTSETSHRQDLQLEVPLPAGADADWVEDWQDNGDGRRYRLIWSKPSVLNGAPTGLDIRAVVVQYDDGSVDHAGPDHPAIYVGDTSFAPGDAFRIAREIIKAAALAQRWGQPK